MARTARKPDGYRKSITVRSTLTVEVTSDARGNACVYHRTEPSRRTPGDWAVYYEDWPGGHDEQLAALARCPLAREQPGLTRFLLSSITRVCLRLRKQRTRYGVPLSEMPRGVRPALKRRTPDVYGRGASPGYRLDEIPGIGPVFGDDRLVLAGRPPRGSDTTPDPSLAEDWREVSRRRGIELAPVAYSGSTTEGTVWFAQRAQLRYGRNSDTEKMSVDASVYAYLARRFPDLRFGLVMVGATPLIALHDGRRRVGFVSPHSTNGGLFHLNFMPQGVERIRNRYEAQLMAEIIDQESGKGDGERKDAA